MIRDIGPHGLRIGPRQYRISFASPGGGTSRVSMDGYSIEDAIRRMRRSGIRIPASLIHSAKCIGQRIESSPNDGQRLYDAGRNVDWDDAEAVARFKEQCKTFDRG